MQEREAILRFAEGEIRRVALNRDSERGGWTIRLQVSGDSIPLENKRGRSVRLFKTSDAALRWCQRLGCEEVQVFV